jgi:hypothetical protein
MNMKDRADWAQELAPTPAAPTAMFYGSSFKMFQELAGKFTGIATVNKEMHMNILGHLRDAVTRKRHENWRTNSWFVLHDTGRFWVLVKDCLAKN